MANNKLPNAIIVNFDSNGPTNAGQVLRADESGSLRWQDPITSKCFSDKDLKDFIRAFLEQECLGSFQELVNVIEIKSLYSIGRFEHEVLYTLRDLVGEEQVLCQTISDNQLLEVEEEIRRTKMQGV